MQQDTHRAGTAFPKNTSVAAQLHSQAGLCFPLQYVTPCNTALQDFYAEGADAVVEDLVDVTIDSLFNAIYETGKVEDIKAPPPMAVPQLPMMTATGQSGVFVLSFALIHFPTLFEWTCFSPQHQRFRSSPLLDLTPRTLSELASGGMLFVAMPVM